MQDEHQRFSKLTLERSKTLKKKKKKSSGGPKKAVRRTGTSPAKKVNRRSTSKPKKTKPSAGKKAPASTAKKGKRTADCASEPICIDNFSAANNSCVCFTGIPGGGSTLSQISGVTYPFVPVTGTNSQGLKFTNLTQSNNCVTVVVPAINQTYPYSVSGCPGHDPGHSVTVNS